MAFPATVQDIKVELLGIVTAAVWTDVTTYVQRRDGGISIARGRADETSQIQPSKAKLYFNNRDGRFSPRNPNGAYYGKIGRNTQIRISILAAFYRFWGEVSAWPVQQDITGTDIWVEVEAAGILRRLGQGASPLPSSMKRRYSSRASVVAYWPGEDGDLSDSISSGLPNQPAMTFNGSPDLAAYQGGFVGSRPIPTMNGSVFKGVVKSYTATNNVHLGLFLAVPSGGTTDNATIADLRTGGGIASWRIRYDSASSGGLYVDGVDPSGALVYNPGTVPFAINGKDVFVELSLFDNGADITLTLGVYEILAGSNSAFTDTVAATQVTKATAVYLNTGTQLMDVAIGQVVIASDSTFFFSSAADVAAINANNRERAAVRVARLLTENGITPFQTGASADTLMNCLQECVDVDGGLLYEPRTAFGLVYRTRANLYNQAATATASYSTHELGSFQPVPDDQGTRNDITVTRKRGGTAQISLLTGPLSTQEPPAGVGTYDVQVDLSLATDTDLDNQAGWRLRLGTVDEDRYPSIEFNMANPAIVANVALVAGLLGLDPGERLVITNPPSFMPPESISQVVQGFSEFLSNFERTLTVNCTPGSPYDSVGVWGTDAVVSRYSSDGSTLAATMTTTATSVTVATTTAGKPLWLTTATIPGDFPFDIIVAGERMTVTAIVGTTSPQTFTVTRSVNGVVKTHAIGESVDLFAPAYYAL